MTVQAASSEVAEAQQESGATARDCGSIPTGRSGGGRGDMVRCADCGTLAHVEPLSLFLNIVDWRRGGKNRRQHQNYSETCDCRSLFAFLVVNTDCSKWPGDLGNRTPDACVTMGGASMSLGPKRRSCEIGEYLGRASGLSESLWHDRSQVYSCKIVTGCCHPFYG